MRGALSLQLSVKGHLLLIQLCLARAINVI